MCDKDRNATTDAAGNRFEESMPEYCTPILGRMRDAFCDIAQDTSSSAAAECGEPKRASAYAQKMRRIAAICCGSLTSEERSAQ